MFCDKVFYNCILIPVSYKLSSNQPFEAANSDEVGWEREGEGLYIGRGSLVSGRAWCGVWILLSFLVMCFLFSNWWCTKKWN